MPTFLDIHTMDGAVTQADVARSHQADVVTQDRYGVSYNRYWIDEDDGMSFELVEARPTQQVQPGATKKLKPWWPTRSTR